ncbi:MAG: 1-phosphofructokinase family hexose kinase [Pseudomonadota bacterium]
MPAILTLTPNPALDLSTTAERVLPTHKLRCGPVTRYAGGGGVNVARLLHRMGADVAAWTLTGGPAGAKVQQLLEQEGVPALCLPIADDTRENLSVVETATGQEFRFVLPGPTLAAAEWQAVLQRLESLPSLPSALRWLVASGSLAPGMPEDFYAQAARIAQRKGARFALDSSGPALAAALQAGVALVKPSLRELRELTGQALPDAPAWQAAAQALVRSGQAELVALSLGAQGGLIASRDGVWQAPALQVPTATGTTGAGDCFLAAILWALEQGAAPPEALRWGMAAGAATLLAPGTALAQVADVQRLWPQVVVQAVQAP